jgi:hypothetical protein
MEPISIATTIAVLFLTKALEKTGEKFGEGIVGKMGAAILQGEATPTPKSVTIPPKPPPHWKQAIKKYWS